MLKSRSTLPRIIFLVLLCAGTGVHAAMTMMMKEKDAKPAVADVAPQAVVAQKSKTELREKSVSEQQARPPQTLAAQPKEQKNTQKRSLIRVAENQGSTGTQNAAPQEVAPQEVAPQEAAPQDIPPQDIPPQDVAPQDVTTEEKPESVETDNTDTMAKPETKPEGDVMDKSDTMAKPETKPEGDVMDKSDTMAKPETKPEGDVMDKSDTMAKPETKPEGDVADTPDTMTKPEAKPEGDVADTPDTMTKPEAKPEGEVADTPDTMTKPEAKPEGEVADTPDTMTKPEAKPEGEVVDKPDTEQETQEAATEKSAPTQNPELISKLPENYPGQDAFNQSQQIQHQLLPASVTKESYDASRVVNLRVPLTADANQRPGQPQRQQPFIDLAADYNYAVQIRILFEEGSDKITDKAYGLLGDLAQALNTPKLRHSRFLIGGHTDSIGNEEANKTLSLKRAEAVRHFLASRFNIDPRRLYTYGFGESRPLNKLDPAAQINRRVDIVRVDSPQQQRPGQNRISRDPSCPPLDRHGRPIGAESSLDDYGGGRVPLHCLPGYRPR